MKKQTELDESGEKRIKVSTLAYALAVVFILVIALGSVLAYGTNTEIGARIAAKMSKVIPFPAAIVDWRHAIFLGEVQSNVASVEKFYQTKNFSQEGLRVDFTTEAGKKRLMIKEREIIDKMVEDKIIEILAKKNGISVSDKDVDQAVTRKLDEFGTADDVKKDLANSYGWNLEDFKQKVVLPSMYQEALAQKILQQDTSASKAKEVIEKAQKELENGKDFPEVARNYSEGPSKEKGGELGWVKKNQVLPELQDSLFGSLTFKKNSILESSIGFHIIDIEDSKKEEGEDMLRLRQVFVSKNTFSDWLQNEKKKIKVYVPLGEFVWDSSTGSVDFADEQMRSFEKEQRSKVQGDASIMF